MNEFIEFAKAFGPGGGLVGMLGLAIYLILTGRLWPRNTVDELLTQARSETQVWRDAYEKSETARTEQGAQLAELVEHSRVTIQLLRGLPRKPDTRDS